MDMNISEVKYCSTFRRLLAINIDIAIVSVIRIIFINIIGLFWLNNVIENFVLDFKNTFHTDAFDNSFLQREFIFHHPIFKIILLFYFFIFLVGAFYHSYLNSSEWKATIGKRIMGVMMVNRSYNKISFKQAFSHYILSVLPIFFLIYLVAVSVSLNISFDQAISYNYFNLLLTLFGFIWYNMQIFTKKKVTAYDLLCKNYLIIGRSKNKFPNR